MSNANDKNAQNGSYSGRALTGNKDGKVQWIYEVK
jgi:hypothetical protein